MLGIWMRADFWGHRPILFSTSVSDEDDTKSNRIEIRNCACLNHSVKVWGESHTWDLPGIVHESRYRFALSACNEGHVFSREAQLWHFHKSSYGFPALYRFVLCEECLCQFSFHNLFERYCSPRHPQHSELIGLVSAHPLRNILQRKPHRLHHTWLTADRFVSSAHLTVRRCRCFSGLCSSLIDWNLREASESLTARIAFRFSALFGYLQNVWF